jgi:AcrR family transcriptional regulator/DNA-binding MarR family transcriptional regulator
MPARRGRVSGRVSPPARVGVRRDALKRRSRSGGGAPGGVSARVQVSEMQRSRLLGAAVVTVGELGWSGASVAHITARARVSRRTFYDLFANREDCLLAVIEDTVDRIAGELGEANLSGLVWRERVRVGLWRILCFFDREPVLARVCVAQALHGGPRVLAAREEILARLARVVDEGRSVGSARECPALTAEGLVGAVFSIVYSRLARGEREPLTGEREPLTSLFGELMGMIVLPYQGPGVARREQERALPPVPSIHASTRNDAQRGTVVEPNPLADLPMRLTYRTARVLEVTADHPGASNRSIGEHAGIHDQGQVSKLLARLQRLGLLHNTGQGHARGERNAWQLTPTGTQITQNILNAVSSSSFDRGVVTLPSVFLEEETCL